MFDFCSNHYFFFHTTHTQPFLYLIFNNDQNDPPNPDHYPLIPPTTKNHIFITYQSSRLRQYFVSYINWNQTRKYTSNDTPPREILRRMIRIMPNSIHSNIHIHTHTPLAQTYNNFNCFWTLNAFYFRLLKKTTLIK